MEEISIEILIEKIYKNDTRIYFQEVYSSYLNTNFRSAIVMLYSVVICDLLYKMQDLEEVYNDEAARSILKEISESQKASPIKSEWEKTLVERINSKTNFFEPHDYDNITQLLKHRNLSAHPVLKDGIKLFSPNKDTVKAHMRNMLEGVLVKSPILSKNLFNNLVEDLEEKSTILIDKHLVELYLANKYLKNLNTSIINDLFKRLWKITFVTLDDRAERNRNINSTALAIIYKLNKIQIEKYIREETDHFSKILGKGSAFKLLIMFLAENHKVYTCFDDSTKMILNEHISSDIYAQLVSWYLYPNFSDFVNKIELLIQKHLKSESWPNSDYIDQNSLLAFFNILTMHDDKINIIKFGTMLYGISASFYQAELYFIVCIKPYLLEYCDDEIISLLNYMNTNDQIYWRNFDSEEFKFIFKVVREKLGSNFDFNKFENLKINS